MRKKRVIIQQDAETGEVLDGLVAYLAPRKQNGFGRRWFAMGQDEALDVLKNFHRVDDFRVLMVLLKLLDYENLILANQSEIAKELGMQRSHVSSAMKRLVEAGVLIKGPRKGINCSYQLNPRLGWKGSAANHKKALSERKSRMKAAKIKGVIKGGKADEPTK